MRLAGNTDAKITPKNRHLRTIAQHCGAVSSQLRHVSTVEKKLVKQQYLLHMSPQSGELWSTNEWDPFGSLGHPSNFNGFRVLPSLLQRRRSPEANQTLHGVWPSPGLLHYIYIFGGCYPLTEFCPVQNSLYVQVLRSPILPMLLHGTTTVGVKLCGVVQGMEKMNFHRGRHLYSAVRPSCWASAHILVWL